MNIDRHQLNASRKEGFKAAKFQSFEVSRFPKVSGFQGLKVVRSHAILNCHPEVPRSGIATRDLLAPALLELRLRKRKADPSPPQEKRRFGMTIPVYLAVLRP
jgi:hypothetical protein